MAKHLTVEQRKMARRYKAAGFTLRETAAQLGCAVSTAREVWYFDSQRSPKSEEWVPGPGRLRLGDREEISLGLHGAAPFGSKSWPISIHWLQNWLQIRPNAWTTSPRTGIQWAARVSIPAPWD